MRRVGATRSGSPRDRRVCARCAILVRPHPQRLEEWPPTRWPRWRATAPSRAGARTRSTTTSRADYFDSLYHAAAVVGLNTSALVEAAIVDRPVFTMLLPEFRDNQEGTFHFHHLLTVGDGFLNVARSLDEHVAAAAPVCCRRGSRRGRTAASSSASSGRAARRWRRRRCSSMPSRQLARERRRRRRAPAPAWMLLLRPLVYALVLAGRLPLARAHLLEPGQAAAQAASGSALARHDATAHPALGRTRHGRCLVIGEVALTHDGSLGLAHAFIDAIADAGADAVKFQTHIAAAESTPAEPFRVKFSRQDATRYDYWKRMEFTEDAVARAGRALRASAGVLFISSPFSLEAVDLLERVGQPLWKIASGESVERAAARPRARDRRAGAAVDRA